MSNNIVPTEVVTKNVLTRFEINDVRLELFKKATLVVNLYSDDKYVKTEVIELSNEEYLNWLNDDTYILNLVCQKLGFTLQTN
jgi:hypothetical protein